jgi:hypothetical protein
LPFFQKDYFIHYSAPRAAEESAPADEIEKREKEKGEIQRLRESGYYFTSSWRERRQRKGRGEERRQQHIARSKQQ